MAPTASENLAFMVKALFQEDVMERVPALKADAPEQDHPIPEEKSLLRSLGAMVLLLLLLYKYVLE